MEGINYSALFEPKRLKDVKLSTNKEILWCLPRDFKLTFSGFLDLLIGEMGSAALGELEFMTFMLNENVYKRVYIHACCASKGWMGEVRQIAEKWNIQGSLLAYTHSLDDKVKFIQENWTFVRYSRKHEHHTKVTSRPTLELFLEDLRAHYADANDKNKKALEPYIQVMQTLLAN